MAADTQVKVGTQWRTIGANGIYVHASGSYQDVEYGYAKSGNIWRTTYIKDETPPGLPTNCVVSWLNGGLRMVWTNPVDADYDRMQLVIYPDAGGEPYIATPEVSGQPGAINSYTWTSSYIRDYETYLVNFRPIDTNGNVSNGKLVYSMEHTGSPRGRTPSPITFRPRNSGTWDDVANIWRTDVSGRVFQGASTSRNNWGAMFYQSQFWTYLRGATVNAARLDLQRINSAGGTFAIQPSFTYSSDVTSPASNPEVDGYEDAWLLGPGMSRLANEPRSGSTVLPAQWRTAMGASDIGDSIRSIIFYSLDQTLQPSLGNVSNSFMKMYGAGDPGPYYGSYPGLIYVEHSG